jgi:vacuolar-type H+-ATPase subunit D/Vma8
MTIKEKSDALYKTFLTAWDNYQKVDKDYAKSAGFNELLSAPELKKAYQKWQTAVSEYYDFARSIEHRSLSEEFKGS